MIILIADDDRLVRFTIKSVLQEILDDGEDIFLEALNGRDMVRICREHIPDVAFVDIRMPYMNGLEAIRESRKYSQATEYVIVSGYSDFEYAQEGIRLGVSEYVLKPVDLKQMEPVVDKLKEKVKKQKMESNSRFQLRLMNAFNDYAAAGSNEMEQPEKGSCHYLVFMLHVKTGKNHREVSIQLQKQLLKAFRGLGDEVVAQKGYYAVTNTAEGTSCILFGVSDALEGYVLDHAKRIGRALALGAGKDNIYYILWFRAETVAEILKRCEQVDAEMFLDMQQQPGMLYEYGSQSIASYEKEFLRQLQQFLEAWELADGIACREVMNTLWRTYRQREPQVDLQNISAYCSFHAGCQIAGNSLKDFCKSFVEQSEKMYDNLKGEESRVPEQVKSYIQQYYSSDISISQIAEHFGLTANYLSTIFHRETGVRFIDYLTETRMEAAKRLLLSNASASVQDIALMVGYNSARHFSTLFQKQTGETPSAYRKARL